MVPTGPMGPGLLGRPHGPGPMGNSVRTHWDHDLVYGESAIAIWPRAICRVPHSWPPNPPLLLWATHCVLPTNARWPLSWLAAPRKFNTKDSNLSPNGWENKPVGLKHGFWMEHNCNFRQEPAKPGAGWEPFWPDMVTRLLITMASWRSDTVSVMQLSGALPMNSADVPLLTCPFQLVNRI